MRGHHSAALLLGLVLVGLLLLPPARGQPVAAATLAATPLGTAFTYQGQLKQNGQPVNGTCDFQFSLYDAAAAGTQIGTTQTGSAVAVSNGLFTVTLDFGVNAFNGDARWLQVAPRCPAGSGAFTALSPRQPVTPAPNALALPGLYTQPNATSPNIIGGFDGNSVGAGVVGATIAGGGTSGNVNSVTATLSTVGGGESNTASGFVATVGGGEGNTASGMDATVGGGLSNTASGPSATVGGGGSHNTASAETATVGGGAGNTASGQGATVGGGGGNTASGFVATVPGGISNLAQGLSSFAAGQRAKADQDGTFVWADSQPFDFHSNNVDQFKVRATGGTIFVSSIDGSGTATAGVVLFPANNAWSALSDRNAKANFAAVDPQALLERLAAIPVETWNYQSQDPGIRHLGPMAQDFAAAFGLGEDERYIDSIDEAGVALAAIQGLHALVQEQDAQLAAQAATLAALEARLAVLEQATGR